MPSPYPLAALLGALLFVLRHERNAPEHQVALLRVIRALLAGNSLRIEASSQSLQFDGTPIPIHTPGATLLSEQLLLHEIGVLTLPADVSDEDLLRLGGVLAAFPGTYESYKEAVSALGATAARLSVKRISSEFEVFGSMLSQGPVIRDSEVEAPDTVERLRGTDLDPASAGASEASDLPSGGLDAAARPAVDQLLRQGWEQIDRQDWEGLLDTAVNLIEAENESSFGLAGSIHRIEFKRLMARKQLAMLARMTHGDRKQEAVTVMRRFGIDAAEVLMELLADSGSMGERRGYYSALIQLKEGTAVIIQHLGHAQWYVVRNAADLCGELVLEDAIPTLGRHARHSDERVRKSVAEALGKIGTPAAIEFLAKMLNDASPAVRLQAVSYLNGRGARGMINPIAELLQREEDAGVQQQALLALGRIGASEAIGVLSDWASTGGKLFRRRGVPSRVTAIKGLSMCGPGAMDALLQLARDSVPEVRAAAAGALEAMRR